MQRTLREWFLQLATKAFAASLTVLLALASPAEVAGGLTAGNTVVVPFIETLNASRWVDLSPERQQFLIDGALDAFDQEVDPLVRALALRILSLAAANESVSVLPALHERAQNIKALLVETAEEDTTGDFAYSAYATLFVLDPRNFTWIAPPVARRPAFLLEVAFGQVTVSSSPDHSAVRKLRAARSISIIATPACWKRFFRSFFSARSSCSSVA